MKNIISWILQIAASLILLQTLYFKFTAQPESVILFTKLGIEPWGRIGTGIIELITGILLLVPRTKIIGAFMGIGVMFGAILSHLMVIGIQSQGDGGQLFMLAITVLVCCLLIVLINKADIKPTLNPLFNKVGIKVFAPLLIVCFVTSCKKKNATPTTTINTQVDTSYVQVKSGSLSNGPYGTVSGEVVILKKMNAYYVQLKNFKTSNGPALHVYLAKESTPVNYLDLGALQSTNGIQLYDISGMPDFTSYKFICIHCIQYNHLFGYSSLN